MSFCQIMKKVYKYYKPTYLQPDFHFTFSLVIHSPPPPLKVRKGRIHSSNRQAYNCSYWSECFIKLRQIWALIVVLDGYTLVSIIGQNQYAYMSLSI